MIDSVKSGSSDKDLLTLTANIEDAFSNCLPDIAHIHTMYRFHQQRHGTEKLSEQRRRPDDYYGPMVIDSKMATFFQRLRVRMRQLRACNACGDVDAVREDAAAIAEAAADCCCRGLALRAARVAGTRGYVTSWEMDELELQLDTAEAMWLSGIRDR